MLKAASAWTSGPKTFTAKDSNGNTLGSFTMMVNDGACTSVSGSASPDPVSSFPNGNKKGQLQVTLTLSVTTSGVCTTALKVSVLTGGPGSTTLTVTLSEGASPGSGSWTGSIAANAASTWTTGGKTATVLNTASAASFGFTVS